MHRLLEGFNHQTRCMERWCRWTWRNALFSWNEECANSRPNHMDPVESRSLRCDARILKETSQTFWSYIHTRSDFLQAKISLSRILTGWGPFSWALKRDRLAFFVNVKHVFAFEESDDFILEDVDFHDNTKYVKDFVRNQIQVEQLELYPHTPPGSMTRHIVRDKHVSSVWCGNINTYCYKKSY